MAVRLCPGALRTGFDISQFLLLYGNDMNKSINLIFEAATVKRIQRTGWQILGDNRETLGEHTFMTAVIAYLLAREIGTSETLNMEKILLMSLFHDFHEARTGDIDKLSTFYVKRDTQKANDDIFADRDIALLSVVNEYEDKQSPEAKIVYEANILALLVELKQLLEKGNANAQEWLTENTKRLRLPKARQFAQGIQKTNSQSWWKEFKVMLTEQFEK
jgi:putative hydrolases of HD superfamily